MLRIKLEMDPGFTDRGEVLLREASALRDLGLDFAADMPAPHLTFVHESVVQASVAEGVERTEPLVIFERQASATLGVNVGPRAMIQKSNVVGWVKEHTLRDVSIHNAPLYLGRHHYGLMAPDAEPRSYKRPIQVSDADLAKIGLAVPHYLNPMFDTARELKCRDISVRKVQVMYAGTVKYNFAPLQDHRMQCCQAIQDLDATHKVIGIGRSFQPRFFNELLRDTKIFVSPYGWGEYSWKDYEAIYAGCVLVKPRSSFVATAGFDIFDEGKYCVECKPDFSDLQEVVDKILNDQAAYAEFAQRARQSLMAATAVEVWAPQTVAYFNRAAALIH